MLNDLRYAFRALRRAPGFTAAAVVTLAIGIGANAAIFNVAWQVLLKPLPYPDESRLVMLWEAFGPDHQKNPVAPGLFLDWQREGRAFDSVAAFNQYRSTLNLTGAGEPAELDITYVTEGFFSVLGLNAVVGRPILPSDTGSGASLLVLSERLWRERFGADPAIVGRVVRLHGEPFDVLGVMPDAASLGVAPTDAWVRMTLEGERARMRQAHFLRVVARLRRGATVHQADADARGIAERAFARFAQPGVAESGRADLLREELTGSVQPALMVLLAGAGLVLLIACANVSGLQMARQVARRRDEAIQAALGASRARLARTRLAEALVLSALAAGAGLVLGSWILVIVEAVSPVLSSLRVETSPSPAVIGYTFAIAALAGVACAAGALWSGAFGGDGLLASRGATAGAATSRLRTVLVAAQVALSVPVLIAAALLVFSLVRVLHVDPGFSFDSGLVINIDLPAKTYEDAAARAAFFERAIERVTAIAGVDGACAMTSAPLVRQAGSMTWVPEGESRLVNSLPITISPGCFSVLRIPIIRGRSFVANEREPVAIVSRTLGQRLFADRDPVGRRVHMGLPDGRLFTIVGVVGDIRKTSLESSFTQQIWLPNSSPLYPARQLIVRTAGAPEPLADAVRSAIREIDPDLPVSRIETMARVREAALGERRFNMVLLLTYGVVGLALCTVGVYGLLSQAVGLRTREIGVRMALGAGSGDVVRHVVLGTILAVVAGCAVGTAVAFVLSRFLRDLLFQVSPADPRVYGAVVLLVAAAALAASYLPARQATRIDPVEALRAN